VLGRIISAIPYSKDGKLVGYAITPKKFPEFFKAQGIQRDDVITDVNGIVIDSPKQAIRAMRNAVKAPQLEISLLRDGKEVSTTILFNQ